MKEVGASDEQIKKSISMMLAVHEKENEIWKDSSLSLEDKKKKLKGNKPTMLAKLKEILGEEKGKQFIEKFFPKDEKKQKPISNK